MTTLETPAQDVPAPETSAPETSAPETPESSTPETGEPVVAAKTGRILPKGLVPKKQKGEPTSRFQQRISELVSSRRISNEENTQLRAQIARLTGGGGVTGQGQVVRDDPNAPLSPENFENYSEYVSALVSRTIDQREAASRSQRGEVAMEDHRQGRMSAFHEAAAPMVEQYGDDFMNAISDPSLPVSEPMADAILELDDIAPYIMLYLANNRQESLKIARMNPRAATVAIGRLAARLDYELKQEGSAATVNEPSEAAVETPAAVVPAMPSGPRAVPVPRGSGATMTNTAPNDKMDMRAWMAAERKRLREKHGPNFRAYGM